MTSFYFLHKNIIENMNENCCKKTLSLLRIQLKVGKIVSSSAAPQKLNLSFFFGKLCILRLLQHLKCEMGSKFRRHGGCGTMLQV